MTVDEYDYDETKDDFGAKAKLGPVALGAEVHMTTKDRAYRRGSFYDPVAGTWNERPGCGA